MRAGDEEVLDEVLVLELLPANALAAAPLLAVGAHRRALDVPRVRDRDDHLFVGDQRLGVDLPRVVDDLGAALVAEPVGDRDQLILHQRVPPRLRGQQGFEVGDHAAHFLDLLLQLLALEPGELGEAHVEDRLGLDFRQLEAELELRARARRVLGGANDLDDRIDVVDGDLQPLEDVLALLRLVQLELRPTHDHLVAVRHVVGDRRLDPHFLRDEALGVRVGDERQHDHAERRLQLRVLVQVLQHHPGDRVALELDNDPQAVAVALVSQVGDPLELLVAYQLGDVLDDRLRIDLVRHLGDHDLRPVGRLALLDRRPRAHHDLAAPRLAVVVDPLPAHDVGARREIRALEVLLQVPRRRLGIVDQGERRGDDFPQVVRRDVRRHADRDPARPVDEQVREARRHDRRLLEAVVVVRREVNGVLVDVTKQFDRDRGQSSLGVSVRRRAVALDRPVVALPVHQRIAQRKVLHHAHQRVVHAGVAMRVILAEHIADHGRALLVAAPRHEAEFVHRVQHAPVHRLEPVTHIGQRARHDHAHRVVDERFLDLLVDGARQDAFANDRRGHVAGRDSGWSGERGGTLKYTPNGERNAMTFLRANPLSQNELWRRT